MAKSISEQIEDLQQENEHLKEFEKLFEKALKMEFGMIRKAIEKKLSNSSDFERKICDFFSLKTDQDKKDFLIVMCSDSSLRFFTGKRENIEHDE